MGCHCETFWAREGEKRGKKGKDVTSKYVVLKKQNCAAWGGGGSPLGSSN